MITDKIGPHHLSAGDPYSPRRGASSPPFETGGIVSSLVGMPMRLAFGKTKLDRVAPHGGIPMPSTKRWQARP